MQQIILDPELRSLLRLLRERKLSSIDSVIEGGYVRYPVIEEALGVDREEAARLVEELEKADLLKKTIKDSLYSCPECGDASFNIKVACYSCNSSEILVGQVIEHLTCGHIDFAGKFISKDKLRCPKCNKGLRAIGVDYRRIGRAYKCLRCGAVSPIANEVYVCRNCGAENIKDKIKIIHVHRHKVDREALSKVSEVPEKLYLMSMKLKSEGILMEFDKSVKGSSGVNHTFTLTVTHLNNPDGIPDLVMDIVPMDDPSRSKTEVLAFYMKAIDVNVRRKAFAAFPRIDEEHRKILSTMQVDLLEADDMDRLVDKIEEYIRNGGKTININREAAKQVDN